MPCMRKALCARSRQQQTRKDEDHMKKFLSLLLALTMVLSLVVVPARADGETITGTFSVTAKQDNNDVTAVKKGSAITFNATATNPKVNGNNATVVENSYQWTVNGVSVTGNTSTLTYTPAAATDYRATCTFTLSYSDNASSGDSATESQATQTVTTTAMSPTVTVYDCEAAVTGVTFNGRTYTTKNSGKYTVYYGSNETVDKATWGVALSGDYSLASVTAPEKNPSYSENNLTAKIQYGSNTADTVVIPVQLRQLAAPTVRASKAACKTDEEITFTANSATSSDKTSYVWYVYTGSSLPANATATATTKTNTYKWTAPSTVSATTTYNVVCKIVDGSIESDRSATPATVAVSQDTNKLSPKTTTIQATRSSEVPLTFTFTDSKGQALDVGTVTWAVTPASAGATLASATTNNVKLNVLTIGANPTATSFVVTAKFNYDHKDYTVTYNVSLQTLSTTLSNSVANGSSITLYRNYSNSSTSLAKIAQDVLRNKVSSDLSVSYATIKAGSVSGGTLSTLSSGTNPYYTFTAYTGSLNAAEMTIVATAGGNNYEIKLTIPVTPITGTSFETVTAEPVSSTTTTTSYRVYFPTTYSSYYVINKTGSTPSSWSNSMLGSAYSSTTPYTLYSTDFNTNGTCTLYVVAKNGVSGNYYSGQMVVTQTNYNINYNGVAGETVQFAQSDFTDFMTEIAEARGDASKTKSYPYVTFDYVTFSLPTTAQGTLYYGGTAMSTSNSSGAFNTRTKVTNLDSVTFVPNAKTTAKTITLNFTLYATRYSSSSTSRGTTVSYSGSVVVNLVREDIKYTVSQGDSVRFDESDFLSYLRSTKGYSSNYTIDYVTFDQSAVSAVNEGSLYTYYNGYNYGGSIKTTDKFYYSATASQNALSDVAFLASRYAKTGETVYIPFTIYARYGTTGTGTRQLTGTVAIKIGQTMNFIDVKTTDYFYNSVKWAVGKNITNGTSSTTFSPYKSCTRAEIVTFLWRAAGSPEPTTTRNPFRDVNAVTHSSYYKAILWASQKGITSGTSTTAFSPDQVCTRAQIVTFLYRYAGQPSGYYSNPFKDVGATSEASYYNAVLWAVGKGITTGTSATTFSPYASCNRAEAVTFLYRYTNGL